MFIFIFPLLDDVCWLNWTILDIPRYDLSTSRSWPGRSNCYCGWWLSWTIVTLFAIFNWKYLFNLLGCHVNILRVYGLFCSTVTRIYCWLEKKEKVLFWINFVQILGTFWGNIQKCWPPLIYIDRGWIPNQFGAVAGNTTPPFRQGHVRSLSPLRRRLIYMRY